MNRYWQSNPLVSTGATATVRSSIGSAENADMQSSSSESPTPRDAAVKVARENIDSLVSRHFALAALVEIAISCPFRLGNFIGGAKICILFSIIFSLRMLVPLSLILGCVA
jgi:hypothetical protein